MILDIESTCMNEKSKMIIIGRFSWGLLNIERSFERIHQCYWHCKETMHPASTLINFKLHAVQCCHEFPPLDLENQFDFGGPNYGNTLNSNGFQRKKLRFAAKNAPRLPGFLNFVTCLSSLSFKIYFMWLEHLLSLFEFAQTKES